jgi:hypothetical protein
VIPTAATEPTTTPMTNAIGARISGLLTALQRFRDDA